MRFTVQVHKDEGGGYWAELPEVPGTVAHGATLEQLGSTLKEVLEVQVKGLIDDYCEQVGYDGAEEPPLTEWTVDVRFALVKEGAAA